MSYIQGPHALWVDARTHAAECARFDRYVVTGPLPQDCAIWIGAIGADGYGRFSITRGGIALCVRTNRYALARSWEGQLPAHMLALHECDNPLCVRVNPVEERYQHLVGGTQEDNMRRMGRAGRGGGRSITRGRDGMQRRQKRSLALREAAAQGWDQDAITKALAYSEDPSLFDEAP